MSFSSCFNSHLERAHSAAHCSSWGRCSFSQRNALWWELKKKSISMHPFFLDFSRHMKGIGKKTSGPSFHWPHLLIVQAFSVKRHRGHEEPITTDPSRCYWGVTTSALTLKRRQQKCSPLVLVLQSFLCITVGALLYTLRELLLWFSIRLINWSQTFAEKYCIYQSQHKWYFFLLSFNHSLKSHNHI